MHWLVISLRMEYHNCSYDFAVIIFYGFNHLLYKMQVRSKFEKSVLFLSREVGDRGQKCMVNGYWSKGIHFALTLMYFACSATVCCRLGGNGDRPHLSHSLPLSPSPDRLSRSQISSLLVTSIFLF